MTLAIGDRVPDLALTATGEKTVRLSDYRGQRLVLYFFPRANTPGCTQEGQDFRDAASDFAAHQTAVLGASRDSLKAQENFKAKQSFPFDLIADTDEALCQAFDVIKVKKMYGKESRGVERSTFLIDTDGTLRAAWRGVKVKGHVAEVLAAVERLAAG
ncbi:peroxiredoxin [Thiococcus pfennigii]|jgi:peroxiredoxin Q/BCP|uniref:peroxiredoxin n=1 Tax=Thiococcus pfennigii TaxID=1057 RepID=UPI001904BE67|nr:peroxiredoxin [Thiococcus pfennigii]MBK1701002.1 peroxiredoxin [Thiococcus pfennigii]MBK1731381.1 peroxiredoxin [Thiococcus pfennigii]